MIERDAGHVRDNTVDFPSRKGHGLSHNDSVDTVTARASSHLARKAH